MANTRRQSPPSGSTRKRLSKSALLPMTAESARDLSLTYHLALAVCRRKNGSSYLINELARAVYRAYYLQRAGFGRVPLQCYERAEAALENCMAFGSKTGTWDICAEDASTIEQLLGLHDHQLDTAPLHQVVDAERQLRLFVASNAASPLTKRSAK
jgi:hypothetical protein